MGDIIKRFTSFDKMMGTSLIKALYFVGAGLIILMTIMGMLGALGAMRLSFVAGLGSLIIAPALGLAALLFWRFMCEIYILFFKLSDDVAAIRGQSDTTDTIS